MKPYIPRSTIASLALASATLSLLTQQSFASGVNSGSSLTHGPAANPFSLYSATYNPAMNSLIIDEEKSYRMNYFPGFALSLELGKVDNFADDLDELIDIIDDPDSTDEDPSDVLERFNTVLSEMGDEGYIKTNIRARAPFLPFYFKKDGIGDFSLDFSLGAEISLSVLDDVLSYNDDIENFVTNTSIYVKSGIEQTLSLGYSRAIGNEDNGLYFGSKLNLINLELSKQVTMLQDLDGREVDEVIENEYDRNLVSTSALGLDLGLIWTNHKYLVGLTLLNANSPSFDYGEVGNNCGDLDPGSAELNSCDITRYFIGRGDLKGAETHTKHARLRTDGSIFVTDNWVASGSVDLAAYDDIVGFENQWLHLSTSYESKTFWWPSLRAGYQKNLTGTELSSLTGGFTLLNCLTFDLEYGLESITVDGSSGPRRFGFAFGVEQKF